MTRWFGSNGLWLPWRRDLHDDIRQVLGCLSLQLQSAQCKLARDQTAAAQGDIDSLISVVRNTQAEMRGHIRSIVGEAESRWEFVPELQELLRGTESRYGIYTTLTIHEELSGGIIGDAELQLLRIVREACVNTAEHAGASRLWVSVGCLGSNIDVVVGDDGEGFNVVDQTSGTEGDPADSLPEDSALASCVSEPSGRAATARCVRRRGKARK